MNSFSFDVITVGQSLLLINGNNLAPFAAVDDDAGVFGDISFQVTSENEDSNSFEMFKVDRKRSELRVTKQIEERSYVVSF